MFPSPQKPQNEHDHEQSEKEEEDSTIVMKSAGQEALVEASSQDPDGKDPQAILGYGERESKQDN